MGDVQIDSFINNFKLLWRAGEEASLKLESKLGEVSLSLSCKVGRIAPPSPVTPLQSFYSRKKYRSPSYFRRQLRRKANREAEEENESAVEASSFKADDEQAMLTETATDGIAAEEPVASNEVGNEIKLVWRTSRKKLSLKALKEIF